MSAERPDFLVAYNAVEVPDTMHSMDANDEEVRAASEKFFEAVSSSLDLSPRTLGHLFEIEYRMLVRDSPSGAHPEDMIRGSDDYVQRFRRQGGQTLAAIMYTRDDPNYQDAHFAKYSLRPKTIDDIRSFQQLERIEFGLE